MVLAGAPAHAQATIRTAPELARKCIADDRSPCSQFITAAIEALESARKARGEAPCLGGQPADDVVRKFIRAVIADYAYSDVSASAAVETIYKDTCARGM
jgi:hypothetical protein